MRVVLLVVLAGCFAPAAPEGAPCGPGRSCPSGQSCSLIDDRCYRDPREPGADAPIPGDAPATTCTPRRLLTGGTDPTAQGWTFVRQGAGTVAVGNGVTTLTTTNDAIQLLVLRDAFVPGSPWAIEMVVEVVSSGGHGASNAAVALMCSFHDPVGDDADRRRMLFLDKDAYGWGEGGASIGGNTLQPVTYRFESTAMGGVKATIKIDGGTTALTAGPFASNGTIAIGDQTAQAGLDSTVRISSVDFVCP